MGKKKESKSIETVRRTITSTLGFSAEDLGRLELAAQEGDMQGQYNLGVNYMRRGGDRPITKEIVETAILWFNKSAEQHYPPALHALGIIYLGVNKEYQKVGIEKDVDKALRYFVDAANQGHIDAQYRAGLIYKEALNKKEAIQYLIQAAHMNHREAQYQVGLIYEEDFETQREALEWFTKAAEQEPPHKDAQYRIAMMYLEGRGVPHNLATAVSWFNKAASLVAAVGRAHSGAQYRLGLLHMKGEGVTHNSRRGLELLHCAATQGLTEAQGYLGIIYEEGRGVAKEEIKALEWLTKAAEGNHSEAQFYLGRKYEEGRGVAKDEIKALEWLTKAAEGNHPEAQFRLGVKYEEGRGVAKDEIKALEWLNKAVKLNHTEAKAYLFSLIEKRLPLNYIHPGIKQLIGVTQNVLGKDYDVAKMFRTLLQEGIPELEDKVFYYYTYEIYPLKDELPATKQPGIVYLYIESDKLHYQMLKHCSSSSSDGEVYSGILEVPVGFNLGRLKDVSFVDAPLTRQNIRQIYFRINDKKTKCNYEVITDGGEFDLDSIEISPEVDEKAIKKKLLDELVKRKFCFSTEDNLSSLKKVLDMQFIQNGLFEPSYEICTTMERQYEEIRTYENNFKTFLDRLIENLTHSEFNNILEGWELFETLKNSILTTANRLKLNQDKICENIAVKFQDSSQMIDTFKVSYQTTINLEDFYYMACLMKQLNELFDKLPQGQKELINVFLQNHPELLLNNYSTILTFPVMFSAQFLTRRKMLFETLSKCFMKRHSKFYELEEIFVKLSGMASTSNMAYGSSNPQVMSTIQTNLDQENNLFKNICFDLVKPIWNLLIMATQQTETPIIYASLLGSQKPIILRSLLNLQEQVKRILQSENRSIFCPAAKDMLRIIATGILPRDEVEQILLDIIKEMSPTEAERIMEAKAEEKLQVMLEEILQGEAKGTLSDKAKKTLEAIIERILQAEMDIIATLTDKIKNTCDLSDIVRYLLDIVPLLGDLALTLNNPKVSPNTSKSRPNNLSDPSLKPKKGDSRLRILRGRKSDHDGVTIGLNRDLLDGNGHSVCESGANLTLEHCTSDPLSPRRRPRGDTNKRFAFMQSPRMGNCPEGLEHSPNKNNSRASLNTNESSRPDSFFDLSLKRNNNTSGSISPMMLSSLNGQLSPRAASNREDQLNTSSKKDNILDRAHSPSQLPCLPEQLLSPRRSKVSSKRNRLTFLSKSGRASDKEKPNDFLPLSFGK